MSSSRSTTTTMTSTSSGGAVRRVRVSELTTPHVMLTGESRPTTGHCRGCGNRLVTAKKGAVKCQCSPDCTFMYCMVSLKKELYLCKQMGTGCGSSLRLCHNEYVNQGCSQLCPCHACKRRRKRQMKNASSVTSSSTTTHTDASMTTPATGGGSPVATASVTSTSSGVSASTTRVESTDIVGSMVTSGVTRSVSTPRGGEDESKVGTVASAVSSSNTSKSRRVDSEVIVTLMSSTFAQASSGKTMVLRDLFSTRRRVNRGGSHSSSSSSSSSSSDSEDEASSLRFVSFLSDLKELLSIPQSSRIVVSMRPSGSVTMRQLTSNNLQRIYNGAVLYVEPATSSSSSSDVVMRTSTTTSTWQQQQKEQQKKLALTQSVQVSESAVGRVVLPLALSSSTSSSTASWAPSSAQTSVVGSSSSSSASFTMPTTVDEAMFVPASGAGALAPTPACFAGASESRSSFETASSALPSRGHPECAPGVHAVSPFLPWASLGDTELPACFDRASASAATAAAAEAKAAEEATAAAAARASATVTLPASTTAFLDELLEMLQAEHLPCAFTPVAAQIDGKLACDSALSPEGRLELEGRDFGEPRPPPFPSWNAWAFTAFGSAIDGVIREFGALASKEGAPAGESRAAETAAPRFGCGLPALARVADAINSTNINAARCGDAVLTGALPLGLRSTVASLA